VGRAIITNAIAFDKNFLRCKKDRLGLCKNIFWCIGRRRRLRQLRNLSLLLFPLPSLSFSLSLSVALYKVNVNRLSIITSWNNCYRKRNDFPFISSCRRNNSPWQKEYLSYSSKAKMEEKDFVLHMRATYKLWNVLLAILRRRVAVIENGNRNGNDNRDGNISKYIFSLFSKRE